MIKYYQDNVNGYKLNAKNVFEVVEYNGFIDGAALVYTRFEGHVKASHDFIKACKPITKKQYEKALKDEAVFE